MSKYGNKKTVIDGITFDSAKEARRYQTLKTLEKTGDVGNIRTQVKYELIPTLRIGGVTHRKCVYIADFVYIDRRTGKTIVEDVKGVKTPVYMLKKRLMKQLHDIDIVEV